MDKKIIETIKSLKGHDSIIAIYVKDVTKFVEELNRFSNKNYVLFRIRSICF